jgi:ubiquinone/menaquinone biosynthesis C-methylase UbiE
VKGQDKEAEIAVGTGTPGEEWLEDPSAYLVKRTHLELLQLIPSQGQLILDAGCGPGTYGIILAQEGNEVIGLEISPQATQVARQRANEKKVNFLPVVGDLEKLPFKDNSFDICFCGWVLHHFPDTSASVAELSRVLKPGGKIALAEPNESNLAMRFSRFVEDLPLLRRWTLSAGWDTPNRTVHRYQHYIEALKRQAFTDIKFTSCFPGGLPPLPIKSQRQGLNYLGQVLIQILFHLRRLLFIIAVKVLPRPLNGADLLVTGAKRELGR